MNAPTQLADLKLAMNTAVDHLLHTLKYFHPPPSSGTNDLSPSSLSIPFYLSPDRHAPPMCPSLQEAEYQTAHLSHVELCVRHEHSMLSF